MSRHRMIYRVTNRGWQNIAYAMGQGLYNNVVKIISFFVYGSDKLKDEKVSCDSAINFDQFDQAYLG